MKNNYKRSEEIATNGYDLEFGTVLEKAFNNYKEIAGVAGIAAIMMVVMYMAVGFGVVMLTIGAAGFSETFTNFSITSFSPVFMVGYAAFVFVFSGLSANFNAGFYKMAHSANAGKDYGIGTLFDYFSTPYFKELFLSGGLISLITVAITMAFEFLGMPFIGAIVTYIVSFLTVFSVALIIFSNLKAIDSITMSVRIVMKNPFMILGLLLIAIILAMVGIIGFCIGIFFTLPFIFSMVYTIYNDIIPVEETNIIDEIGVREDE